MEGTNEHHSSETLYEGKGRAVQNFKMSIRQNTAERCQGRMVSAEATSKLSFVEAP